MSKKIHCTFGTQWSQLVSAIVQASFVLIFTLFSSPIFSQVVPDGYYVDGWDYAYGSRGYAIDGTEIVITENIDPETNNLYPNGAVTNPDRMCMGGCGGDDGWYCAGDVGEYRVGSKGCHTGEDMNYLSGTADAGFPIYASANGQVVGIFSVNMSLCEWGWVVVMKHYYENGSYYHSVYKHVTTANNTDGTICPSIEDFTVAIGGWVTRGQIIARIATGYCNPSNDTHLHFEIRDSNFNYDGGGMFGLYPRDNQKQSYGGFSDCIDPCTNSGQHTAGMDVAYVNTAYDNMGRDGIIDPSDFIEVNRPSLFAIPAPEIEWQNTIGGDDYDYLLSLNQTTDGGYVLGGYSTSSLSGDKTEHSFLNMFGQRTADYWIMKLNSAGNYIEWQNTLGGDNADICTSILQTSDNGYILGGLSYSSVSIDKSEPNIGGYDIWVVKVDSMGTIQWDETIGGVSTENLWSMGITLDGGYILGASSSSNSSADKTESNMGANDFWVIKLDAYGDIEWENTIGGTSEDFLNTIKITPDNGYILGGFSLSGISGDKTEANKGEHDIWIVKIDNSGEIEWQKTIGGNQSDILSSILVAPDSSYILGGYSSSGISGDKTEANIGSNDFWVIKLDVSGNILWQKTIGGTASDYITTLDIVSSGGYILGGISRSNISGDKSENARGLDDFWIVKIDNSGEIEWQKTIGGNLNDNIYSIHETAGSGYILGGYSESSISGDKTEPVMGVVDYWIVKLAGNCTPTSEICNSIDDDCDGLIDNGVAESISISAEGPTTFCQGSSVILTATYSGTSIQWKKDGVDIAGATNPTYTATTKATYAAMTTSLCGSTTSSGIFVNVNKNPIAAIIAGGATTFCAGGSVTLTANAGAGLSYQWYKGATAIVGETNINYVATTTGNYKCRVTKTATGCFKNSNAISVSVTCKSGINEFENISIYPNPASSYLEVHFDGTISNTHIVIVNSLGQIVLKEHAVSGSTEVDISPFATGLYTINLLQNGNVIHSEKIIIE